jgi:MFS superfamily sulfate permease-like transporter
MSGVLTDRRVRGLRPPMRLVAFVLALATFPVALAAQEVSHLAAYSFFGVPSSLLVTPWRFHLVDVWVFGLHAAAGRPPSVPVHVAADVLGPVLPTIPLLLLWLAVRRASPAAAAALLSNVLALAYFAVIELAFALAAFGYGHVIDQLLWPEVSYGPVLAIMALVCALTGRRRAPQRGG